MLVLSRKQNESIRLGENIVITVLRTKGKKVRLGIEAPDNVHVLRGELEFGSNSDGLLAHDEAEADAESGPLRAQLSMPNV